MDEIPEDDLAKLEERFLADLEQRPVPTDALVGMLRFLRASGKQEVAEIWAQTLQEALVEIGDTAGLLRLLIVWTHWRGDGRGFGSFCHAVCKQASKDRLWSACVASVSFSEIAPSESLRRLELLMALQPGSGCLDKTWGFGVVKRVDDFYKRMVVDFTLKPNHTLTLAYAAEALSRVQPEHLLATRHRDPAAVARLVAENPAEVVRLALRSFGPLSVARLETMLTDLKIVAPADWKRFWDGARKVLRADPLVDLPGKRTEPLTLRAAAMNFDRAWFEGLRAERDTATIMRLIASLEAVPEEAATLDDEAREALSDRLAFAVKGAYRSDAALYARLALMVRRLRLETPPAAELRAHLWEEERFVHAAETLPARDCGQLVALLMEEPEAPAWLLAPLPRMNYNLLSETIEGLLTTAAAPAVKARCRELLAAAAVPPALLVWILRNRALVKGWPLPTTYELLAHAIAIIEDRTLGGESLRMQHQLRALFENAKWFEAAFAALSDIQQEAIFDRIYGNTTLWDPATQRTLVGRMVKLAPSLANRKQAAPVEASTTRWTSWRSLRERREQFKQLLDVDIPRNSQDLAAARSHGDLRENFEFQAAKQQQGVLLGRRDQWDLDLKQIRGTNFDEADSSVAGMGVEVLFERADGRRQRIAILGEWDRDEALGIVANRSRLAMALEGKRAGDQALIPGVHGDESVTILAVEPLGEAVRAWVGAPAGADTN